MKKNNKLFSTIFQSILLTLVAILCINMGAGKEYASIQPSYVPLEEGEGSYFAIIYDEGNAIEVKDISFTGHTKIGGIRKEDDDSVNRLDLSNIKELHVLQPNYLSKKYSDKEFILAKAIALNDTVIEDLLIPRQVVICAIEKNSGLEKAWFLYKLTKIVLAKKETIESTKPIAEGGEKGVFHQIKEGIKSITSW